MLNFFSKFLDSNNREVSRHQPLVDQINSLEKDFKNLKEKDFKAKTAEFKARLDRGETLDDLLSEAFALVREASVRTTGLRHYDVQLIGGIVLHQGKIAEMKTGEGKTLVATLPLYLNALTGKGVHLVTVNDYLSRRDAEWNGPIYHLLGLNVGVINHEKSYLFDPNPATKKVEETEIHLTSQQALNPEAEGIGVGKFLREVNRQEAYQADIIYGTNNEFGFDYLRDNMVGSVEQMVQTNPKNEWGAHHFAIVDEVDSILIDEARTPLIISAQAEESTDKYYKFAQIVATLTPQTDFVIDEKLKTANLTEIGINKIERTLGVTNLFEKDFATLHHIEQALKAETLYRKDRDYVVREGEVVIVDEFTGRLMFGRRFSEGLHQAIEAKEKVEIQRESRTLATVSFQNYFRMYEKLAGMTGTAVTEAEEFYKIYKLEVVEIPTNQPNQRKDHPDSVYKTERAKYEAIIGDIVETHKSGQPILVGTTSIEKNELLADLLKRKGVTFELLNAKNHEKEAQIIAKAGQKDAITLATNIAGRGVDIKLGEDVDKLGGLYIIGTERHESRRIDNQLRGRSGRQGDPGETRFYISLNDDIMRLFGGDQVAKIMDFLKVPEDVPIENGMVSKAIESSQSKVEGFNFDSRKHLVEYDDVMNKQREIIYGLRRKVLESSQEKSLKEELLEKIQSEISSLVILHAPEGYTDPEYSAIATEFGSIFPEFISATNQKSLVEEISKIAEPEKIIASLQTMTSKLYDEREKSLGEKVSRDIEKYVYLQVIDTLWMNHLDDIDDLRGGIGLRAYGQRDPLVEYKAEAYNLFERLVTAIDFEVVHRLFHVQVQQAPTPAETIEVKPEINLVKEVAQPQEEKNSDKSKDEKTEETGKRKIKVVHSSSNDHNHNHTAVVPQNLQSPMVAEAARSNQVNNAKVGRNDPCPCGSGLKWKKCGLINSPKHRS